MGATLVATHLGEAGGVREQVADGDLRRVGGGIKQLAQLRHVALGGIVQREPAGIP